MGEIKRFISVFVLWTVVVCLAKAAGYSVYGQTCENMEVPLGIDASVPRFSWKLNAEGRGVMQSAYQIVVAESEDGLDGGAGCVWNSGRIESDKSIMVDYGGQPLKSATTYYWKVRSWSDDNECSGWSTVARFTTGLLSAADWGKSRWIALEKDGQKIIPAVH